MEGLRSTANASKSDCADCNCVDWALVVLGLVKAAADAAVARRMQAVVFMVCVCDIIRYILGLMVVVMEYVAEEAKRLRQQYIRKPDGGATTTYSTVTGVNSRYSSRYHSTVALLQARSEEAKEHNWYFSQYR